MRNILITNLVILIGLLSLPLLSWGQQAGSLDATFNPGTGANGNVIASKILPNGKILITGNFTNYQGVSRNGIARLNADGSIDTSFNTGTGLFGGSDGFMGNAIALQSDGKVIVAGRFDSYNGYRVQNIARIHTNGRVDTTFYLNFYRGEPVTAIAIQNDDKIIIGGRNGYHYNIVKRLNANGRLDTTFRIGYVNYFGSGDLSSAYSIAVQSDGKILVGGYFSYYDSQGRGPIVRLNNNGTVDTSFQWFPFPYVTNIAIQEDGKILVGIPPSLGVSFGGNVIYRSLIARLNDNGSLDMLFNPNLGGCLGGSNSAHRINAIAIQPNGNILVGGYFDCYNSNIPRNGIARLKNDGSLDSVLVSYPNNASMINTLSIQPDKKIIVTGTFTTFNGISASGIVRIFTCTTPNTPSISGNNTICAGSSTVLTSSAPTGNLWSNGDTTRTIIVSAAGNYTVSVISGACTSTTSETTIVTVNGLPTSPSISSSNGTSICSNETTTLSVGNAAGYIWSNGATTATITVGAGTYSVRTLNAEGCTSAVSGEVVITQQVCNQTFTGVGNLNSNSNWSTGAMPTTNTDIIVDGVLTFNINFSLRNITVNPGDTIKIPSGVTFTVTGNLANEGVITGLGTLLMAGTNNQSIGGGTISNLTVANSQSVGLSAATSISGTLTLGTNTTFDLNNNTLTLLSNATQTARLAAVPSGASLIAAGNFTVQRWLNPTNIRRAANATGNYYLLGPIVQNQTVGLWNGVSPYAPATFNQSTPSGGSFYFYNTAANNWIKPISLGQSLPVGVGAQVWFGTQAFFLGGRTTWSASGTPVVGNFNLPITNGVAGFNLVSNPYPSTIDWDSPNWTKTGVANAIYIFDWVNFRYKTYVNGIQTNGASRYLPTAQGFFVNTTTTSAVLTARENIKVSNQLALQRTESQLSGIIRLQLTNGTINDEMVIANRSTATAEFEADQDAQKMMNPTTNIFVIGAVNQSIASMNLNGVNAIPFVIQTNATGSVTLNTTEISGMEGYTFNLFNEQTGELLPYTGTETYTFNVTANQPYHLQLRIGSVTGINTFKASSFEVYPNPASDKVTVNTSGTGTLEILNTLGQVVITQPAAATNEINISKLAKGVYTVKFNGLSQKLLVR